MRKVVLHCCKKTIEVDHLPKFCLSCGVSKPEYTVIGHGELTQIIPTPQPKKEEKEEIRPQRRRGG